MSHADVKRCHLRVFSLCLTSCTGEASRFQVSLHNEESALTKCSGDLVREMTDSRQAPVAVREFTKKSAASAASPDYGKFQAEIKSAASAASLRGGRASGRLDHGLFWPRERSKNDKNGLKTRLTKKTTFSILVRRPRALPRARSPGPRPRACEEGCKI